MNQRHLPLILAGAIAVMSTQLAEADDLVIADKGASEATIVVSPQAGTWEKGAASDLALYIERMSGAKVATANTADAIAVALKAKTPLLIIGQEALTADPDLRKELAKVAKKDPALQADAIALRRSGNRVYLAGTNDDSHYFAVAELLRRWGCRWYFPSDFGECIPQQPMLKVGKLDYAYAPPFEIRNYWIAWNGEQNGREEFKHRNFMNNANINAGHAIGAYTKDLVPAGKTVMDVAIAEDATAEHVAKMIAPEFAKGVPSISLGMEDGTYRSDSPRDKELQAGLFDKYFIQPALTDGFMTFYNKVAEILMKQYPNSPTKLGFLAYSNITIPPQRNIIAAKPLITYLAPIDIDPNHGMDDGAPERSARGSRDRSRRTRLPRPRRVPRCDPRRQAAGVRRLQGDGRGRLVDPRRRFDRTGIETDARSQFSPERVTAERRETERLLSVNEQEE